MMLREGLAIEGGEDFSSAGRGFKAAANFAVGEHLGDGGEGLQMELIVFLRDEKQNDKVNRCLVECLEIDAVDRAAEDGGDVIDFIKESMRDGDSGADAGADEILARLECGECGLMVPLGQELSFHQTIY